MDTLSNLKSNAEQICNFVSDKCKSKKARVVLGIGIGYLSLRILKLLYKRRYDKVKYVTLEHVLSSNKKYDFIVVGAGTAGSCVAGLIARDGRRPKVLLIEAGDRDNYHPLSTDVLPIAAMFNQKTSKDWSYYTVPQKKGCDALKSKQSYWPRGKICGGTSVLNYMCWVRGNPEDYNEWADVHGCKGWSWKEIVPTFRSLEKCTFNIKNEGDLGVRGFDGLQTISRKSDGEHDAVSQLFVKAAQEAGYEFNDDYNGVSQDGVSYTQFNIDTNGRRVTSFRAFVATLFADKNEKFDIDILPNAQVTKILSKDDTESNLKVAYGVQIDGENICINEKNRGEIVISGGAVNSPHLLMLSGIGDAEELQQHGIDITCPVPGVGKNLRDHLLQMFTVTFDEKTRNAKGIMNDSSVWTLLNAMKDYVLYGKGLMTTLGMNTHIFAQSTVAKRSGLKGNDLQLVQLNVGGSKDAEREEQMAVELQNSDLKVANQARWAFRNKGLTKDHYQKSVKATTMLVRPKSVGTLKLKSADPFDHPLIDPNYLSHPDDAEVILQITSGGYRTKHGQAIRTDSIEGFVLSAWTCLIWNILTDLYQQNSMKVVGAEVMEWERFESHEEAGKFLISNNALTIYHPVGTCKMGNLQRDKMAVCSERLRVRGFKNLRVADASIAPNLVAGNTQAMCTLIGCKAAEMIMEDWQSL